MILRMRNYNQAYPLGKGLQFDDEPEIFDFETEEKRRLKLQNGSKNSLPIKTANKPGKILEFKKK